VIEDADFKSNEIVNNIGNFFMKIANQLDEEKKDISVFNKNYLLEQAKAAD
jgi:hypothetical protein